MARKSDGGWIPLDAVAPCYEVQDIGGGACAERALTTYVSHFATCPQASQHSRRKPAAEAPQQERQRVKEPPEWPPTGSRFD